MSPKEKAKELVDSFYQLFPFNKDVNTTDGELHWEYNDLNKSKKAALIAVEELIRNSFPGVIKCHWEEVKQEIEKL